MCVHVQPSAQVFSIYFSPNTTLSHCKPLSTRVTALKKKKKKTPPTMLWIRKRSIRHMITWCGISGLESSKLLLQTPEMWYRLPHCSLQGRVALPQRITWHRRVCALGDKCCGSEWNSQHQSEMLPPCCAEPTNPAFNPMCEQSRWLHELTSEKRS